MGSAVKMRTDYSEAELRRLAKSSRDSKQSRRLLSLVAVLDGMSRAASRVERTDSGFCRVTPAQPPIQSSWL
ncbi:hypothetical protein ASD12_32085 [Mesorhizobium sp. Root102]|nr:hypothetical protein ASD12_32085 [Mesorhizobium sp. Root102]